MAFLFPKIIAKSIEEKGVLVTLILRKNPYGDGYEIIFDHIKAQKEANEAVINNAFTYSNPLCTLNLILGNILV